MQWYYTTMVTSMIKVSNNPRTLHYNNNFNNEAFHPAISALHIPYSILRILSKKVITKLWYQICNFPHAHVIIFIHTIHISLIIVLIRTSKEKKKRRKKKMKRKHESARLSSSTIQQSTNRAELLHPRPAHLGFPH